ncbi:hypothetical protein ACOSQ2_003644 [Xanthoceras sorbifolium]
MEVGSCKKSKRKFNTEEAKLSLQLPTQFGKGFLEPYPFGTHLVNMWVFFVATCSYCLELSIYSQCNNSVILSSDAISSISVASIFLPRLLGWLCLSLWTVLPIVFARHFIKQIYQELKNGICEPLCNQSSFQKSSISGDKFKRLWDSLFWKNQHLPVMNMLLVAVNSYLRLVPFVHGLAVSVSVVLQSIHLVKPSTRE